MTDNNTSSKFDKEGYYRGEQQIITSKVPTTFAMLKIGDKFLTMEALYKKHTDDSAIVIASGIKQREIGKIYDINKSRHIIPC